MLAEKLSIWVNGRDVTGAFRVSPITHTLVGLVDGLAAGKNSLEVKTGGKVRARLEIINHAITGPIFSGPHQTPFICQTESMGLGPALDADCSAKTEVTYLYKSTHPPATADRAAEHNPADPPAGFKRYDPSGPRPDDMAEVTTSEGKKVKYIVRWEMGTINRAIYEIAFLHEPGTPLPDPWTADSGVESPPGLQLWRRMLCRIPSRPSPQCRERPVSLPRLCACNVVTQRVWQ